VNPRRGCEKGGVGGWGIGGGGGEKGTGDDMGVGGALGVVSGGLLGLRL